MLRRPARYLCEDENEEAALFVVPAKAGIQANFAEQTWIPACAGITEAPSEGDPFIFIVSARAYGHQSLPERYDKL
jgi:hypothetical protein